MSLEVLTAIWKRPPCKGGDLLCLLAIADNADDEGYGWPSVATIARKAAMSERGAQKCLAKLSEAGLIEVEIGGGRGKSNAYQITTNGVGEAPNHQNPEQNTPNRVHPLGTQNPEQCDINPEQSCIKPRTPVHPNRKEPPKEPSVDRFDEFWEIWPNKVARVAARSAFKRLPVKDQIAALDAVRGGWFDRWRKQYPDATAIHPATYLNKRRWEDQSEPVRVKRAVSEGERVEIAAAQIQSGKRFLCTQIPPSIARAALRRGLVTEQQCRDVGVSL